MILMNNLFCIFTMIIFSLLLIQLHLNYFAIFTFPWKKFSPRMPAEPPRVLRCFAPSVACFACTCEYFLFLNFQVWHGNKVITKVIKKKYWYELILISHEGEWGRHYHFTINQFPVQLPNLMNVGTQVKAYIMAIRSWEKRIKIFICIPDITWREWGHCV